MAIDAGIALQYRPPAVENPTEGYARVLSLGQMMQQRELNAERLQSEQLRNKEIADKMADDQLLGQTIAKNTLVGPDGQPQVNHQAIVQSLAGAGKGHLANQYTQSMIAQQRAALDDHTKQFKLVQDKLNAAGQLYGPIAQYDPTKTPPDQLESAWQSTRQKAGAIGVADPSAPDTLLNTDGTVNPAALAWAKNAFQQTLSGKEQLDSHERALTYADQHNKTQQELASGRIKSKADAVKLAAQTLSAAADDEHWQAGRTMLQNAGVTPDVLGQFANDFSPEAKAAAADLGMTSEERAAAAQRKDNSQALADYREESLSLRREAAAKEKAQTANSAAVDRRQAMGEINKLEEEEARLNRQRVQLGSALNNGELYIPPTGTPKSMKVASQEQDLTKDALIADMAARYQQASGELKRVIGNKYNQYGRVGVTPGIPIDKVHGAIDAGDVGLQKKYPNLFPVASVASTGPSSPAPAASAPTPAPAAPTKTYTEAQVRAGAIARGLDPNDAVTKAKSSGLLK